MNPETINLNTHLDHYYTATAIIDKQKAEGKGDTDYVRKLQAAQAKLDLIIDMALHKICDAIDAKTDD